MLHLSGVFLSDQPGPRLDPLHGGPWRWPRDRGLLLFSHARRGPGDEVSNCMSTPVPSFLQCDKSGR